MVAVGTRTRTEGLGSRSAARRISRTCAVLPEPAGPVIRRIKISLAQGE
jgi:hypothetical protein